jgi:hypothetical protein
VWYPVKALYIVDTICVLKPKLYLSPSTSQSPCAFCGVEASPFGGGVELGGRMWYPVKVLHIRHHLFAGTETLSLSVYEQIAMRVLRGPHLGQGVERVAYERPKV